MIRSRGRTAIVAALLGAGCFTFAQSNTFDTTLPEPGFDLPGRVIVLTPVTTPDDLVIAEERVQWLDSVLHAELAAAGYDVIPATAYGVIWDSLTQAAGGFFDSFTGTRNDSVYDAAVATLHAALKERFDPDVLMYPELWVTEAYVVGGYAYWDGHREVFDLRYREGPVLALSLLLAAEDLTPRVVFNHGTGVQILERIASDNVNLEMIDAARIMADTVLIAEAVGRLLEPLLDLQKAAPPVGTGTR